MKLVDASVRITVLEEQLARTIHALEHERRLRTHDAAVAQGHLADAAAKLQTVEAENLNLQSKVATLEREAVELKDRAEAAEKRARERMEAVERAEAMKRLIDAESKAHALAIAVMQEQLDAKDAVLANQLRNQAALMDDLQKSLALRQQHHHSQQQQQQPRQRGASASPSKRVIGDAGAAFSLPRSCAACQGKACMCQVRPQSAATSTASSSSTLSGARVGCLQPAKSAYKASPVHHADADVDDVDDVDDVGHDVGGGKDETGVSGGGGEVVVVEDVVDEGHDGLAELLNDIPSTMSSSTSSSSSSSSSATFSLPPATPANSASLMSGDSVVADRLAQQQPASLAASTLHLASLEDQLSLVTTPATAAAAATTTPAAAVFGLASSSTSSSVRRALPMSVPDATAPTKVTNHVQHASHLGHVSHFDHVDHVEHVDVTSEDAQSCAHDMAVMAATAATQLARAKNEIVRLEALCADLRSEVQQV